MAGVRHDVRRLASVHPGVYLPVARRKYPDAVVGDNTELVIDGFTRSAVTFAVVAFQLAQNDHVRVAHHLHAAAHLMAAARRGIPALVPVRPPEDAILSALIREPLVTPRRFLASYVDFYERIRPLGPRLLVATFDEVTGDFGAVIDRVNQRYGTRFARFAHDEEHVARCFELIDERARRPSWEPLLGRFLAGSMSADEYRAATAPLREREAARLRPVPQSRVQRPSEERRGRKDELRVAYLEPGLASLRARAQIAYEAVVGMGPERGR